MKLRSDVMEVVSDPSCGSAGRTREQSTTETATGRDSRLKRLPAYFASQSRVISAPKIWPDFTTNSEAFISGCGTSMSTR